MPFDLTPDQQDWIIKQRGLDPNIYGINPATRGIEYRPKIKESPTVSPTPSQPLVAEQPTAKDPSIWGGVKAGARAFASSVLPTAAGLAAGSAAGTAAASSSLPLAGIPVVGPFIPPLVGLGTGLVTAYGASKAQEALLPETVNQQLATDVQQYPVSTALGNVAAAAPFLAANPSGVLRAGKTAGRMLMNNLPGRAVNVPVAAAEMQNLANVALGAGVGAGQSVYEGMNDPNGINIGRLIVNTLGNAALNDPNKLGRSLLRMKASGELPPSDFTQTKQGKQLESSTEPGAIPLEATGRIMEKQKIDDTIARGELPPGYTREFVQKPVDPLKNIEQNIITSDIRFPKRVDPVTGQTIYRAVVPKSGPLKGIPQDKIVPYKSAEESAAAIEAAYNPENAPTSPEARKVIRIAGEEKLASGAPALAKQQTPEPKPSLKQREANRESNYTAFKSLMSKGNVSAASKFAKDLGETYYFNRRYSLEKASGKTEAFGPMEEGQLTAEMQKDLANRRRDFQTEEQKGLEPEGRRFELQAAKDLKAKAQQVGTSGKIQATKSFYDLFNSAFSGKRNVKVGLNNELVDDTGKPARGATDAIRKEFQERVIEINPKLATPDTLPHEYTHSWFEDLKNSPLEYERKTAANLERAIAADPDIIKSGLKPSEALAETSGYEIFNRAVNLDKANGTLRRSWEDFLSTVRLKWGKASAKDTANFISKRFLNDPDFVITHIEPIVGRVKTTADLEEREKANAEGSIKKGNEAEDSKLGSKTSEVEKSDSDNKAQKSKEREAEIDEDGEEFQPEGQGLTPTPESYRRDPEAVAKMSAEEFKDKMSRFTKDAFEYGLSIKGQPDKINRLKELSKQATDEFTAAMKAGDFDKAMILSTKPQYFNEALQGAEGTRDTSRLFQEGEKTTEMSSEDFEIKPKQMEAFGLEKVAIKIGDKIITGKLKEPINHALLMEREGFPENAIPGFINKKGEFIKQYSDDSQLYQNKKTTGLRSSPAEIREDIDKTIHSPEFKKAGDVRRAIKNIGNRLPIIGSDIDRLKTEAGASGRYIAPALKEVLTDTDSLEGRFMNPSLDEMNKLSIEQQKSLADLMTSEDKQNKSLRDTITDEKILSAYDTQRALLKEKQELQKEWNIPVDEYVKGPKGGWTLVKRDAKVNPNYYPQIAGTRQIDILLNHEGSQAFEILKNDFIKHAKNQYEGFTDSQARELFEEIKSSYGGFIPNSSTRFGAVRKAEGIGLPNSWLEANPATALKRYWRRVARDLAWGRNVESDPNNLHILGQSKDLWGKPVVPTDSKISSIPGNNILKGVLDSINGTSVKSFPKIDAYSRIANNLILGPMTGINDLISALPIVSKFAPSVFDLPRVYFDAVKNLGKGIKDARSTGRIKNKISDIEDIASPVTEHVDQLRQLADGIAKVTGRQKLEEFSRGLTQSAGASIIKIAKNLAEGGNEKMTKFLEGLANKKDWREVSDAELASRIVDLAQGTYDVRGLPSWVINSQLAPFFRLTKWNIEQLNNLHKFVIMPATKGNLTPLLITLGGGVVGGELAKEAREKITQKKSAVPSWSEIYNSPGDTGNKLHGATYALAAGLSYSGVLGLLGEALKMAGDVSFKNKPQGFNYPAMELATDMVDNLADASQAIVQEGEDPIKVLTQFSKNLFTNNIQVARLASNISGELTGDRTKSAKEERRDLRVFNQLAGYPVSPSGSISRQSNPYIGLDTKDIQQETDIRKLPGLVASSMKRTLAESKGEPELLRNKLNKLKGGAVTTLPSPESDPKKFAEYYSYLKKTFGEEEARKRLKRYGLERAVGNIRRGLIPSI